MSLPNAIIIPTLKVKKKRSLKKWTCFLNIIHIQMLELGSNPGPADAKATLSVTTLCSARKAELKIKYDQVIGDRFKRRLAAVGI